MRHSALELLARGLLTRRPSVRESAFAATALSAALLTLVTGAAAQATATRNNVLVRCGKAWLSPERAVTNASVLLESGKVGEVVTRQTPEERSALQGRSDVVLDYPKAVVTAGFLDMHTQVGAAGELAEQVESLTPELKAAEAYDPFATAWRQLVRRGVTSAIVSPDDRSLAGGMSAFVKPGKPAIGDVDAYMKMSLTESMLNRERRPTSLMGATEYLRESFTALQGLQPGALDESQKALATIVGGGRPVAIACDNTREIRAALDVMSTYQLSGFLVHATKAAKNLAAIKDAGAGLVLRPLSFDAKPSAMQLPNELAKRNIPFAFAGESSSKAVAPRLQTSLALAVRAGLPAKDALASVTTVPAQMTGLSERVGTLFKGRDADLIVWSGDPWDLRSKVLAVVQGGKVVYRNEAKGTK